MKRLVWLTDIHLNCLKPPALAPFYQQVIDASPDALVITGDIGEAPDFASHLHRLALMVRCPIYFVLGNHDFYRGSIAAVREQADRLTQAMPGLHWLSPASVVALTEQTALVGHDGWGDGRLGLGARSSIMLNDFFLIEELRASGDRLFAKLAELGDEAAAHFRRVLPEALQRFQHVLVATHVPPFREACWHEGRISDADWLPHFTCQAAGAVLVEFMQAHPDRQMTVLCGHTHSGGTATILPNLLVKTGAAVYGQPAIQEVLALE